MDFSFEKVNREIAKKIDQTWLTQIIANPGHQHLAARQQQNDLYAEVGDPDNLALGGAGVETSLTSATSFNNNTMQDPAPYATTALAMQNRLQTVSTPRHNLIYLSSYMGVFVFSVDTIFLEGEVSHT